MPFSVQDGSTLSTVKVLRQHKQYGANKLFKMFPDKNWTLNTLQRDKNSHSGFI